MEWIPIDRDNLPEEEVLAAKFEDRDPEPIEIGYGLIRDEAEMGIYCYIIQCKSYAIDNVTHYFDPKTIKIPQNQSLN